MFLMWVSRFIMWVPMFVKWVPLIIMLLSAFMMLVSMYIMHNACNHVNNVLVESLYLASFLDESLEHLLYESA